MTLAIGDLQGCDAPLERLLARAAPAPDEPLWFCGDLVNRGPDSLGALRRVRALGERAVAVLGNHDLHLLVVAAGLRRPHRQDTLGPILAAPDRDALLDWLRRRPLAHRARAADGREALLVHAGVVPEWSAERAVELSAEVEAVLRGPDWIDFLRVLYGDRPERWDDALSGDDRLRAIVNVTTRLRYMAPDGTIDFASKEGPGEAPAGLLPWFDMPGRRTADATVVFGHWSTLGLLRRPGLLGLDTGCVWGGRLTAVRLEDGALHQVDCPRASAPAGG